MNRRLILWFGAIAAAIGSPARAQEAGEPPAQVILIRPAEEPTPALRYRFLSERRDLIPGNAAILYHRAIEMLLRRSYEERIALLEKNQGPDEVEYHEDPVQAWLDLPLDQFPKEEARRYLGARGPVLHELELAARRESCDWEFLRRDEGLMLMLEDIPETKALGSLIALQARLEIAEGRVEEAIRWAGTGLALAVNVGRGHLIIQSLIASNITYRMAGVIEELIQTPGCPNLYWALTALPRPLIDLTSALEGEENFLEREFPQLRGVGTEVWSLDTAREFGDALEKTGAMLFERWPRVQSGLTSPSIEDLRGHAIFLGLIVRSYPEAKRSLLAEGVPPQRVEAMPAIQAVALRSYRNYVVERDDLFKWMSLPYRLGQAGLNETARRIDKRRALAIPFSQSLMYLPSASSAIVRIERRFAVLRIIEGVRRYAAAHDGTLPPNLAALSATPAPDDPATGEPFGYKLEGETAILTAPPLTLGAGRKPYHAVHIELRTAR